MRGKGKFWKAELKVVLLIADLPAKSSILNMQQFNAYYGCTLCFAKCCRGEGRSLFYPNCCSPMRSSTTHKNLQSIAQRRGSPHYGVKGPAEIFDVVPHLPLTAPVDYMHQVLIGVTRIVLLGVKSQIGSSNLEIFNNSLQNLKVYF